MIIQGLKLKINSQMSKPKFSLAKKDEEMWELIRKTDHKTLAVWAIDCAERVLPFFEEKFPNDQRLKVALGTLQNWIDTGKFSLSVIRKASLDSHAAAREVGEDNSARSAARACGQAVATAHVPSHSYGAAIYAQQAIFRKTGSEEKVELERTWQYKHLLELCRNSKC